MLKLTIALLILLYATACSTTKKIAKQANALVLLDRAMTNANVGISIFDPSTNQYLYNHNANKYFVPASNTKIATCYAAMKYLGDSLVGLRYVENDTALIIQGTGDPSFLVEEYKKQPVTDFLQKKEKKIILNSSNWKEERWGSGWNWNDFGEDYCQERSVLPMYYNSVAFIEKYMGSYIYQIAISATPFYFNSKLMNVGVELNAATINAAIHKEINSNVFNLTTSKNKFGKITIPYTTGDTTTCNLLKSSFKKEVYLPTQPPLSMHNLSLSKIYSQPTDSVLKPMMHRSDNFFAEQSLLMVSNEKLGYMNDEAIISHIKKNDFVGIPQMPRWVDGSGLSRYNMFTPQSIIFILNKMKNEFGMQRIHNVFATGGEGTLSSYYKNISGKIFAKTGTLSNHVALSGFLYTKNGKLLIFSTLVSGYQGSATPVRKAVEKLLQYIHNNY